MPQIMPKVWTSNISASECVERGREGGNSVANCGRTAEGTAKRKQLRKETRETGDQRDLALISSAQTEIV